MSEHNQAEGPEVHEADPALVPRAEDQHVIAGGRVTVPVIAFAGM